MTNCFYSIISFFFFIFLLRNILFWVSLWQIKEYRSDRLRAHLLSTRQGRSLIFGFENIIKITVLLLFFLIIFVDKLTFYYSIIVSVIYLISFIKVIYELTNKKFKLPKITIKSILIFFLTFLIGLLLYLLPLLDKFFWLVFVDKILTFIIAFEIALFSIPSDFYKDLIIYRAVKKRNLYKKLLVIGVTGSYGKGSTKEYLATILSGKFNILKTPSNNNTSIGVAKTILSSLNERKQIFVVEMGAYKIGEIKEICSIAKPRVGILTAVNDQHIALFGNLNNTMKAKYELIESLPNNGFSMFNAGNPNSLNLACKTKRKKIIYFADYNDKTAQILKEAPSLSQETESLHMLPYEACENKNLEYDIVATNIKIDKFQISFNVELKNKNKKISSLKVRLLGGYNVENLLPGIYLADYLGMTKSEIRESLKKILPIKKTMEPFITQKKTVFIDDTYNSGFASVDSAVEYMKLYKGKKALVLSPLIELGKNASFDHYSLALKIGGICDYLILTNNDFIEEIKKGIDKSQGECVIMVDSPKNIASFISVTFAKNDVVVFEGREAGLPLKFLEYEK